jgi:hypothetical protein
MIGSRALVLAAAGGAAALAAGIAAAAAPVSGTIAGPVTSTQARAFTLKSSLSPTGSSKVHVGSSTVISEQANGSRADLKKGACASAFGPKDKKGVVAAIRVMLSAPVQGRCATRISGGGLQSGSRPPQSAQRQRPPQLRYAPPGNFGFASGGIAAVDGNTLTLRNQQSTSKVTVSAKTQIVRTVRVGGSAVKVGLCAFVRGTSSDKGVNVSAQDVSLFKPGPNGCTGAVRRP